MKPPRRIHIIQVIIIAIISFVLGMTMQKYLHIKNINEALEHSESVLDQYQELKEKS